MPQYAAGLARLILLLLLAGACGDGPVTEPPIEPPVPQPRDVTWLRQHAIPFATAQPGGDYADLMPLKEIIGSARIVALGEGTHGTREFFLMKHRVLEFLVREMGFDLFAIEATWAESNDVNAYVRTGVGDPAALLSNLHFWTWNTQEVLDMIEWMRRHNVGTSGSGVGFHGFDMQFSLRAMNDVLAFIGGIDPMAAGTVAQHYSCWRVWERAQTYGGTLQATKDQCRAGVAAAYAMLAENEAAYVQATSPEAYARALRAARIVVQHEYTRSNAWQGIELHPRDRFMAENAAWLLDQAGPGSKMVIWAHNGHVMDSPGWMGAFLRQRYGSDLVIAGFSFEHGSFNAYPWRDGGVTGSLGVHGSAEPLPGSYEHSFAQLDLPRFLADLRPLRTAAPAHAAWLNGPLPLRMIGAVYHTDRDESNYFQVPLARDFDILIHFRSTTPTRLLPFVSP